MKIKLKAVWMGIESNMQAIPIGEYDSDAPELFGLADYLVLHGHASVVGQAPKEALIDPNDSDSPEEIELNQKLLGDRIAVKDGKIVANIPPKPKAKK